MLKTTIKLIAALGITVNMISPITVNAQIPNKTIILPIQSRPITGVGWQLKTTSTSAEIGLAKHLTSVGAKMYGAWWCPHCHSQKQLFGKQAFSKIKYIECDNRGKKPQQKLCIDANIKGFPTWEINGELYPGVRELEELAELSKYQGNSKFKYQLGR